MQTQMLPPTFQGLEASEKTSLYRMIPGTQAPGKVVFVDNNFERQNAAECAAAETLALSPLGKLLSYTNIYLKTLIHWPSKSNN